MKASDEPTLHGNEAMPRRHLSEAEAKRGTRQEHVRSRLATLNKLTERQRTPRSSLRKANAAGREGTRTLVEERNKADYRERETKPSANKAPKTSDRGHDTEMVQRKQTRAQKPAGGWTPRWAGITVTSSDITG